MKRRSEIFELKIHEFKFALKKLEIHQKINRNAMMQFSDYFKDYIDTVDNRGVRHRLKQIAGLAGEGERHQNKTAKKAKQQAQYRKGRTKVQPDFEEQVIEPAPDVPKKPIPKEYKSLYRKIATKTHPDKIKGDPEKKKIFQEVNRAIVNEDYFKLVESAMLLDIEIPDEISLDIGKIDGKIEKIKSEVMHITKSVAWEWYHMEEDIEKKKLIEGYATYLLDNK
jgi:hypothetical protein